MHGLKWRRKKGWNGLSSKHLQYKQIVRNKPISFTLTQPALLSPHSYTVVMNAKFSTQSAVERGIGLPHTEPVT